MNAPVVATPHDPWCLVVFQSLQNFCGYAVNVLQTIFTDEKLKICHPHITLSNKRSGKPFGEVQYKTKITPKLVDTKNRER